MPISLDSILLYVALGLIVVFIVLLIRLESKIKNLLGGTNAQNIEEAQKVLRSELKEMQNFSEKASAHFQLIEKRLRRSIQGIETVRFNPFKGTGSGGNQSFSTAFINEQGDGVVVSTLHSRERISVFSKPIKQFTSEFELSDEEKQVVAATKENLEKK